MWPIKERSGRYSEVEVRECLRCGHDVGRVWPSIGGRSIIGSAGVSLPNDAGSQG